MGRPSWTSPGLTVMRSPGPASTMPRPLADFCAPRSIRPMPNSSWMWREKARAVSARTMSTPGIGQGRRVKAPPRGAESVAIEEFQRARVGLAIVEAVEGFDEDGVVVGGARDERQRGAELQRVDLTEDLLGGSGAVGVHQRHAFAKTPAEDRVGQKSGGFVEGFDAVELGRAAETQAAELREEVPHPVADLATALELAEDLGELRRLGGEEAVEVEGGRHGGFQMRAGCVDSSKGNA